MEATSQILTDLGALAANMYAGALSFGFGQQITYKSRRNAAVTLLAFAQQPHQGESREFAGDTDTTVTVWKIPAQQDNNGADWPPTGIEPAPEDKITDGNNEEWDVVTEQEGAITNFDRMNAIWEIVTRRKHPHRT